MVKPEFKIGDVLVLRKPKKHMETSGGIQVEEWYYFQGRVTGAILNKETWIYNIESQDKFLQKEVMAISDLSIVQKL